MPTVKSYPGGPKPQWELASGLPAVGNQLFWYVGVNTKQNTYTDSTGTVANSNPIVLNSLGMPPNEIWLAAGLIYKLVYAPSTDTDPPTSPIYTVNGITGVNDTATSVDQWAVSGLTPTFVSGTSFTLVGDQTTAFHPGRRIRTTNSGGTIYSYIATSVFGALTTITTVNDSGSLDAGLSAVALGILTKVDPSIPLLSTVALQSSFAILNGTLVATVVGGALNIIIKNIRGADPTPGFPAVVVFRNATAATGDYTAESIVSATSLTVSAGSTLGTTNNVPFRFWIVGFNDASTFRLGVVNALSVTSIMALRDDILASSTAEGGAGGADTAQVIYTGTAVSAKAMRVLGYLEYSAGLAAVGTYGIVPTKLQLFGQGVSLPGEVVQTIRTDDGNSATGTTVVPFDNSIPQITEGDQYISRTITHTSAANLSRWTSEGFAANDAVGGGHIVFSLYQDAVANAKKTATGIAAQNGVVGCVLNHEQLAATTSLITVRLRIGAVAAGTTTFNGSAGAVLFGGVFNSYIKVEEIMA